jgi:class 3 adenylate cyclase
MHAVPACPACGMPRSDLAVACPHCGAPSAAATEGARKSVALLFADIAGSTPLIDGKDPETAHDLLTPALDLIAACVRRYGGTVNRVTGDGVMALFGAPSAMEDHVLAACCAAVAMQAELPAAAPGIALRVGIHAGEVMIHAVRAGGASGLDAAGDAVHLAARLQQAAEPGKTLVSGTIVRAAGARLSATPLPPMLLRGLAAPVAVSELTGVSPELTRLEAAGAATLAPFVGRTEESMILAKAMAEARVGRGAAIALSGEAGIGKSRLIHEFARHGLLDVALHEATFLRWREAVGFHPLRPLLRRLLLLDAAAPAEEAHARIAAMLAAWPEALRDADALAAVLDFSPTAAWRALDPKARRRRMVAVTVEMLARLAEAAPVLLVVDDLHWADAETLEVLGVLAARAGALAMLLVLCWRPEFADTLARQPAVLVLPMDPLDPADAADLAGRLLAEGDTAEAQRLAQRAAGNPLFIESQAAARREQGTATPLPDTVRALLGARIDRAGTNEKRLLEAMAAHGEAAPIALIAELAELPAAAASDAAATLAERRLAVAEGVGAAATLACAHALIQDVTYADMTRARRRVQHGRTLHVLECRAGDAVEPVAETLARHARLAEDFPRLVRFARMAGKRAAARNANTEAVRFYEDALDAVGKLPVDSKHLAIDVQCEMRNPLEMYEPTRLIPYLEQAATLADELGDALRISRTQSFLAHAHWVAGRPAQSIKHGQRAIRLARRADSIDALIPALYHCGLACFGAGRLKGAASLLEQVGRRAKPTKDYGLNTAPTVLAQSYLARTLAEQGRFNESAMS